MAYMDLNDLLDGGAIEALVRAGGWTENQALAITTTITQADQAWTRSGRYLDWCSAYANGVDPTTAEAMVRFCDGQLRGFLGAVGGAIRSANFQGALEAAVGLRDRLNALSEEAPAL
jgi:hypothetical protein